MNFYIHGKRVVIKNSLEECFLFLGQIDTPITICQILEIFSGKGRSFLLIFLSLPFCQPIQIPGFSTPFGLAIAFIGLRMAFGKRIWLPKALLGKTIAATTVQKIVRTSLKIIRKMKKWIHPRMAWMCRNYAMKRVHGILIALLGILLALPLPIPFSNLVAAWPLFLISLGILEDDGLLVAIGYLISCITILFFIDIKRLLQFCFK